MDQRELLLRTLQCTDSLQCRACSMQLSHCRLCCALIGQAARCRPLIGPLAQGSSPWRRVWRTTQCQVQGHAGGTGGPSYWPLTGGKSKNAFFLCKNKICNLAQFQCDVAKVQSCCSVADKNFDLQNMLSHLYKRWLTISLSDSVVVFCALLTILGNE